MRAFVLVDKEAESALADDLRARVTALLARKGYRVDVFPIGAADVVPCTGCLRCHVGLLGTCVFVDALTPVNAHIAEADVICFIGPMLFGQMGSTMKTALDKIQTNRMRSLHTIVIGHGEGAHDDEVATFLDIVAKHGGAANVVHARFVASNEVYASRSIADDTAICQRLESTL